MIKKRNKVFETNSSSVHTVTLSPGGEREHPNYHGAGCDIYFKEFGWSGDCDDWQSKVAYLTLMAWHTIPWREREDNDASLWFPDDARSVGHAIDMIKEKEEYKHLEEVVCKWINSSGLVWYGKGYIDHQSCEDSKSLNEWLQEHGIDTDDKLLDFIFGDSYIEISNDNGDW